MTGGLVALASAFLRIILPYCIITARRAAPYTSLSPTRYLPCVKPPTKPLRDVFTLVKSST